MPKVNVAYRLDDGFQGVRLADKSRTNLKSRLRETPNSNWRIAHYVLKNDATTFCQCIEDMLQMTPVEVEDVRINEAGQVRKV